MPVLSTSDPKITSLKGIHLYHAGISNCSMRVRLMLEEKGLSWESHEIDLGKQENIEPWYMAINPKGLVPAIVHDGVPITESNDILHYLEHRFPDPAMLPSDPRLAQDAEGWVDLASAIHMKAIKTWVYGTMGGGSKRREDMDHYAEIEPDKELVAFHQKSLDGFSPEELETARKLLTDVFGRMEMQLQSNDYLVGDRQSLADIAWLPQYVLLNMIGFDFRPYPAITAWAKRQEKRPGYDRAIRAWMPKLPGWIMRPALKALQRFRAFKRRQTA